MQNHPTSDNHGDDDAVLVPPAPYSLPAIERGSARRTEAQIEADNLAAEDRARAERAAQDDGLTPLDDRILGLSHADSAAALLLIASRHPDLVGAALHRVAELTGGAE